MATIPSGTKFIGLPSTYPTAEKRSSLVNAESGVYTMQDIIDTVPAYKVFTALLTQSGGNVPQEVGSGSGPLTIGKTYTILSNDSNTADFTNVGAPNNEVGTFFIATGTTPNSWGINDDAELASNGGAPVATVLENTIGDIWFTYVGVGSYFVFSDGLFTQNKSSMIVGNVTWDGGSGIIKSGFDDESSGIIITSLVDGTNVNNGSLLNTPIEIRVYN